MKSKMPVKAAYKLILTKAPLQRFAPLFGGVKVSYFVNGYPMGGQLTSSVF